MKCSVQSTGGSVYNVNNVLKKELNFGFVQSDVVYDKFNGVGKFDGNGDQNLRAVVSPVDRITEIGTHLVKSGGKRLRPALFLLAARSSKDFDAKKMMPLAVALELIHMASLVHDDVLDHADTRRGAVTANAMWGNQQAILSGDYFFARAFLLIVENGFGEQWPASHPPKHLDWHARSSARWLMTRRREPMTSRCGPP